MPTPGRDPVQPSPGAARADGDGAARPLQQRTGMAAMEPPADRPAATPDDSAPQHPETKGGEPPVDRSDPRPISIPLRRGHRAELLRQHPLARQPDGSPRRPALTRVPVRPSETRMPPAWEDTDLRPDEAAAPEPLEPAALDLGAPAGEPEPWSPRLGLEAPPPSEPRREPAVRPGLEIRIGKIEVRTPPAESPPPPPEPFKPRLSLEEYLRQRRSGLR